MNAKIRDLEWSLRLSYKKRAVHERLLLEELDYKSHKFRRRVRSIRSTVGVMRSNIWNMYMKKITHYHKIQAPTKNDENKMPTTCKPTIQPKRLNKFETLSVFGTRNSLPK